MLALSCGGSGPKAMTPATPQQMAQLKTFDSYGDMLKAVFDAYMKGDEAAIDSMIAKDHHTTAMCAEIHIPPVAREGNISTAATKCKAVFTDVPAARAGLDTSPYGTKQTPGLAPSFHHWNGLCKELKIHSPTPYRYEPANTKEWPVIQLSAIYKYKGKWGLIGIPTCR